MVRKSAKSSARATRSKSFRASSNRELAQTCSRADEWKSEGAPRKGATDDLRQGYGEVLEKLPHVGPEIVDIVGYLAQRLPYTARQLADLDPEQGGIARDLRSARHIVVVVSLSHIHTRMELGFFDIDPPADRHSLFE